MTFTCLYFSSEMMLKSLMTRARGHLVTLISVLMLTRQRGRVVSAPDFIFRDPSSSPALTTRGIRYGYMINCLLPVEFLILLSLFQ